ncbi:AAA family ATPase [Microcystis phage MinS1]|nr:AAA family ATPase [Microcystis phage MinS1]
MTHTDDRPHIVDDLPPEPPPWDDPPEPTTPTPAPEPRPRHVGAVPPHDYAAEQAVLGAALIDPTSYTTAANTLTPSDFYDPRHETIWAAIGHLHAAGHPTAAPAVVAHLLDTQQLRGNLDAPYIHTLMAAAPHIAGETTYYANRVHALARRRAAISQLTRGLHRLTTPGPDSDVDQILTDTTTSLIEARDQLVAPPAPTTWAPVALDPVLAGDYLDPPPTMLTRSDGTHLLYDGAVHTISGESESGKTWLTLLAAVQLLADGFNVVFIDFEDRADRVIARLLALGAHPNQIRRHFSYIRPDRPLDDDGRAQLTPHLPDTALVILDGVTEAMTMHGYDLNSNADSALFQGLLPRWIADHGPAVVMIDHVVKDKERQDRFALGAQHKLAGIDGVAYIVKMVEPFARGKRGLARVEIAKDRPGHVREQARGRSIAEFALDATASDVVLVAHLVPPGEQSGRTGDTWEPTVLMEKVSRYVQLNPGMSKKAIEGAMNGKASTIRLALELLVSRQYIGVRSGPRGAVQHFHHKAYYADGDPTDEDSETPTEAPSDTPSDTSHTTTREAS